MQDKEGLNDIRGVVRSVTNQPLFSADRRAMLMPTSKAELPVPNMRYSNDRRLWDVDNLLQTVRPRVVKPEDRPQLR